MKTWRRGMDSRALPLRSRMLFPLRLLDGQTRWKQRGVLLSGWDDSLAVARSA